MKKFNENDIIDAILGAAIMASAAEQAEPEAELDEKMKVAQTARDQYEAFIEVGFTEEQATAFIVALMH